MAAGTIESLRAEVETLRETLRQYQEAIRPSLTLPRSWNLRKGEESYLMAFYAVGTELVSHERMYLAVWGPEAERDPYQLCNYTSRVREKLAAAGVPIKIKAIRGQGWCMDADSAAVLRAAVREASNVERVGGDTGVPGKALGGGQRVLGRRVFGDSYSLRQG